MNKNINFSHKSITKKDINSVANVLKSGWLTHGKYTQLFENEFSNFIKSIYFKVSV